MRTHYENLHVSDKASPEVIRAAYKVLAQKWHPDKHPDQREKAERYFRIIARAFEVLSEPKARAEYDAWLANQRKAESPSEAESAEEPPQASHTAAMAEAWEDGKRSCEQGFCEKDCPYTDVLAEAWHQGFKAGTRKQNQTPNLHAKISWLGRLWRGEAGFWKTFLLCFLVGVPVVFFLSFFIAFLIPENRGNLGAAIRTAQLYYISYIIFALISTFRAAYREKKLPILFISLAAPICIILAISQVDFGKRHVPSPARLPAETPSPINLIRTDPAPTAPAFDPSTAVLDEDLDDKLVHEHFQKIYAAHPDTDTIAGAPNFVRWKAMSSERERIVEQGTADEVIKLINEYKATQRAKPARTPDPAPRARVATPTPYPNCVIFPVMTDADYAACGITPPGS